MFPEDGWYRHEEYEYNECVYQPANWERACRFVVMRIRKDQMGDRQLKLLDSENYVYRVFVTSDRRWPYLVIEDYDQRAGRKVPPTQLISLPDHTIRIARLKMPKIRFRSNRDEVLYSMHEQRAAGLTYFLKYLDRRRKEAA